MSFYRIGNTGLIISADGVKTLPLDGVVYPPVSEGRLWLNLDYQQDWARDSLFIDVMRTARAWRAQTATEFNDDEKLAEMRGDFDEDGYPTVLPSGVTQAASLILMEQAAESADVIGGRYKLVWEGSGTIEVGGGSNQTSGTGWIEFDYEPDGSNSVDVRIKSITPGNHPRGMKCYLLEHEDLLNEGKVVHPAFKAAWGEVGLLRFMLPMDINKNTQVEWSEAPTPTTICRGPSWLECVKICNELGVKGWFNIPMAASADYVEQMATLIRDNMNPALHIYIEWANEWWNSAWGFDVYRYLEDLIEDGDKDYNFAEAAGGRSTECMLVWSDVFSGKMDRCTRVINVHTHWHGLEEDFLEAPGWVADGVGRVAPHTVHDAIAVTGYFSPGSAWQDCVDEAETDYEDGLAFLVNAVKEDIEEHRTNHFPHFRGVADDYGMQLVMYEGGSHTSNPGGLTDPEGLANDLANDFNQGEEIYDCYDLMMAAWDEFGDTPFNQFNTTRRPETAGAFGAQHYINDFTQPRYDALMDYNTGVLPSEEGGGGGELEPKPLNQKLVISGHSISDGIAKTPLADAISALGGTAQKWTATGPHATMGWRWTYPVDTGTPDNVKSLMEAGGAAYDAFVNIEAHGGSSGRLSVVEHIRWSDSIGYGVLWHNLAASTGAQPYMATFWRSDPDEEFGSAWRAAHESIVWVGTSGGGDTRAANKTELEAWDVLIDEINAGRASGTPPTLMVPWLQVFLAVYDAIQASTVTGLTFSSMFTDEVHVEEGAGKWLQLATLMLCVYHVHPDNFPANAGSEANISSGLASQLRPIVWNVCTSLERTGLAA